MTKPTSGQIVVIDDDTAVLESYQFILRLSGYEVAAFSSALAYLEAPAFVPCCMILDQHMPLMTGLELAQKLAQMARKIPIMLITAAPTSAVRARAVDLGIAIVMEKPPSEDEILRFVCANC